MSGGEAVEATVAEDGHTHESACLNCRTPLAGSHCHACGQPAHVHKTLAAFFHDLLHGVFHFEGKIWRTLPLLAWRPGQLTREYIDGRRASYVSPIALFLFVVFVTFALFNAIGAMDVDSEIRLDPGEGIAVARASLDNELTALRAKRERAVRAGRPVITIDAEIAANARNRTALEAIAAPDDKPTVDVGGPGGKALGRTLTSIWRKARENPALLIYKLQSNAYKYSWLLIPLSVPFVWLLFPFSRRFGLYDHTVFVTYSISFMLLVVAAISLMATYGYGALATLPSLYVTFHLYRQLRETYGLSHYGALWRTIAIGAFIAIVLTLFALALFTLVMSG